MQQMLLLLSCFSIIFGIYTNELKNWFLAAPDIPIFEAACIAQLIQVELLQRRFAASNLWRRLSQIPNF